MTLGEIIKTYRSEHSISMAEFAKRSGMSKSYVALLEKNVNPSTGKKITPSIKSIQQAAIGMNMSFDALFEMVDYVDISQNSMYISDLNLYSEDEHISEEERKVLQAYRLASYVEKLMVFRALHIDDDSLDEQ